jgi:hypothetical protein
MLELTTWTDISRFNNSYPADDTIRPIDFVKMQDQGVEGVCIRKSIGRVHDPAFEQNWQRAGDVGLKRTVYCVPYVAYDMGRQQEAMSTWPGGGIFDGKCDIPAWDDVERKHKLTLSQAITKLMPYHYAMVDTFGAAEFYTARYVWQDFYSKKQGWQKDWGLVVANYRKDLYHLGVYKVKDMVAKRKIYPAVPLGWLYHKDGNVIASHLRWEQWQIFADWDKLGPQYGCPSRDIDISFRQGRLPPVVDDPDSTLQDLVLKLREAWGVAGDVLTEIEEEVSA